MTENRLKIVRYHRSWLTDFLTTGVRTHAVVIHGLPEGAELIRWFDEAEAFPGHAVMCLIYAHESFPVVPEAEVIPELPVELISTTGCVNTADEDKQVAIWTKRTEEKSA
jgi:hypothetical protein